MALALRGQLSLLKPEWHLSDIIMRYERFFDPSAAVFPVSSVKFFHFTGTAKVRCCGAES